MELLPIISQSKNHKQLFHPSAITLALATMAINKLIRIYLINWKLITVELYTHSEHKEIISPIGLELGEIKPKIALMYSMPAM